MPAAIDDVANSLLEWETGQYKIIGINMDMAGPATGAWVIDGDWAIDTSDSPLIRYTATTLDDHGLSVGDRIAVSGAGPAGSTPVVIWAAGVSRTKGMYVKPSSGNENGKKYLALRAGTSHGTTEPNWPVGEHQVVADNNVVWQTAGADDEHPINRNWVVEDVPATDSFSVVIEATWLQPSDGYVANLEKTFLSQFAASGARSPYSGALTGKDILSGFVLDADDTTLNLSATPTIEVLLLLKTAELHADTPLADTAQRIIAYYDTASYLPFAAAAGTVAIAFPNDENRILRPIPYE
jgi:hypothetical protein